MLPVAALLLAGCTQDDVALSDATPAKAVAITFACSADDDAGPSATRAANGYTGVINKENNELYYTGFGVFAAQSADGKPDLMYNQQVEYVFRPDSPIEAGYWTYTPLKYWPADISDCYLCAYAPYVDMPSSPLPSGTTGITGMSSNDDTTPYLVYTRASHPEDNVDLLWGYFKPEERAVARLQMHHALARLRLNLTLTSDVPAGTKVLLRQVRLSGTMAQTGHLVLSGHATNAAGKLIPTWTDQTLAATTIDVYADPENHSDSYGVVAEGLRYVADLPYAWQPAGLTKNQQVNVLCMGDYPSFVYLIPQGGEFALDCTVYYTLVKSDGTTEHGLRKTDSPATLPSLNGNTTYDLNLNISLT